MSCAIYIALYRMSPLLKAWINHLVLRCGVNQVTSADTVAKKMKSKFTKSWITYLRVPLPLDVYKELLDSCLKSAFLPAYLAASFVKKLIRLLLSVSPSGSLVIIALIHNLLRRHPSINCLVHQDTREFRSENNRKGFAETGKGFEAFQIVQVTLILLLSSKKPRRRRSNCCVSPKLQLMRSLGAGSSLWETDTILHHYCPPVSRFALSLGNDLTVMAKTSEMKVEDFSSGSYDTVFGDEGGGG